MQNLFNRLYIYTLFIIIAATTISCHQGHDHDHDDHDHDASEMENETDHNIVLLNQAQYINAEIDTGWFDRKNLTDVIHANGYTKLDPQDQADVTMPVAGTIKKINVIEGDYVKKGAILAHMSSLAYSKMILENNGLIIERNKLLLEKANLQREQAQIQESLAIAESKYIYLEKEYGRQMILVDENINARKLFENVQKDLAIEMAKISSLQSQLSNINYTLNKFSSNDGSFEKQEMSGINKELTLDDNLSNLIPVLAPISGYITDVFIKIGSNVSEGNKMFSLVDNSKMHVDLLVYEKDLNKVEVGQQVRFILTNQNNREIKGEIYNIGKSFENETKTVAVHADIEKNDANLIPGMYINALIDIGTNTVNSVPTEAVVMAEGREFIFLWEKSNELKDQKVNKSNLKQNSNKAKISFKRLEVKTGSRQLGFVEITPLEKINEGDKIVKNGSYYLQSHLLKMESGGGHHH